jgi:cytoplasmic iron level regulating protein YaaA (DUF328/UPF0246 family)
MLLVLSPAKNLRASPVPYAFDPSVPEAVGQSAALVKTLRTLSVSDMQRLMGVSRNIAELNGRRYREFSLPFTPDNAVPALLSFHGDVYRHMQVERYGKEEFAFAQKRLRILSGLYGSLRPCDLMQPYRLEMGTRLKTETAADLYGFWGADVSDMLARAMTEAETDVLLNLASQEYFKAVKPPRLPGRTVTVHFKERGPSGYRVVGVNAKRARGMAADFVIRRRIALLDDFKSFSEGGYAYRPDLSGAADMTFVRE